MKKISLTEIENAIKSVHYTHFENTLTICVVTLKNGYHSVGHSRCSDPTIYDKEKGEKKSYKRCIDEIWSHMGFYKLEEHFKNNTDVKSRN